MKLLLINTCGSEGIVGLAQSGAVVAEQRLPGRGASESLVPAIRTLFERFGWTLAELAGIGVVAGPGSFTGVRVGLSVAKGLCEAGAVGMVALSRLSLLAEAVAAEHLPRVALLDAGRREYFGGLYGPGREPVEELMTEEEARAHVHASSQSVTCEARVVDSLGRVVQLVQEPGARQMLATLQQRIAAGAWSDVALTDAHYLRRTDAELLVKARERRDASR